ncbi:MAG: putative DNA modification/repair radical SAM protein [Phycisphaerales bacterium]|nr:putative DNA modification/repair radical SAM protein [Phycisphaerales bacterium]
MNLSQKLSILADAAKYDASCASSGSRRSRKEGMLGDTDGVGICHSYTPDGRCVSLLKLLLTNYCIYDCRFCVNRVSSDTPRARFSVDEVVWLTIEFYKRNYIEGLFLSSGIIQSPDYTMERLAEIARRLRQQEQFNGYIHLKAIPGADPELIDRAGTYADRLSANIELPTDDDLAQFAPEKSVRSVDLTMSCIKDKRDEARHERKKFRSAPSFAPAGQSTQLIVGATPSPDATILQQSSRLYKAHKLKRVYYSAFSPIPFADGDLPATTPPLIREHRLYQADWLLRFYGFDVDELTTQSDPDLSLDIDPKHAWALRNPDFFPVDINKASREALLRIPGIGVRNVSRILKARKNRSLRIADLRTMRIALKRAQAFIVTPDWRPPEVSNRSVSHASDEECDRKPPNEPNSPPAKTQKLAEAGMSALFGEL